MSQSKSKLARALETIADLRRQLKEKAGTPSSTWAASGEPDPHSDRYNCERAELALGDLTDDELANGAFMNYDRPLDIDAILSKRHGYHSPIAWMTAVKDRIRWLSRRLEEQARPTGQQDDLWAVHAQGPDDLYAAFSREDAEQHAAALNALSIPGGIQVAAVVVPSPWSAAEHWKYAAEQEREHATELKALAAWPAPHALIGALEKIAREPGCGCSYPCQCGGEERAQIELEGRMDIAASALAKYRASVAAQGGAV